MVGKNTITNRTLSAIRISHLVGLAVGFSPVSHIIHTSRWIVSRPHHTEKDRCKKIHRTDCEVDVSSIDCERRRQLLLSPKTWAFVVGLDTFLFFPDPISATTVDTKTGIRLPDPGEIEASVPQDWTDVENPFLDSDPKSLFARLDDSTDSSFYQDPRFVEHVDDVAVQRLADFVSNIAVKPGDAVLDLCSSWVSHIDSGVAKKLSRVAGLGMNEQELQANSVLTEYCVQDLNENPQLSKYSDNSFDVVLCQLSIDYLTRPLEVLKEVSRILNRGGRVYILFSNRWFFTKAIAGWTGRDDIDHTYTVACYLHFCGGNFREIQARDLSTRKGDKKRLVVGDPLYVVSAVNY